MTTNTILKVSALALFATISTSLACPAKKGYMLNGGVPLSPLVTPICGPTYTKAAAQIKENFRKAGHPLPAGAWIEIYGMEGFDWLTEWSQTFVTVQKNRGLKRIAEFDVNSGAATLYQNPSTGRAFIEYQLFDAPGGSQFNTWIVYIGNW